MRKAAKKMVKSAARPTVRLVPIKGCLYTQKEIQKVIGPSLLALAEKHRVELRQITAKQVYADIEGDPSHPLWQFINRDRKRAMREWVLQQIQHLMSCVRIERADIPQFKPQALFVSLKDTSVAGTGGTGRASVVSTDAEDEEHRDLAKRIADGPVERIRQACESLASWCARSAVPTQYSELTENVRVALAAFDASNERSAVDKRPRRRDSAAE